MLDQEIVKEIVTLIRRSVPPTFWGTVYLSVDFKSGGVIHVEAYHRPKWDPREMKTIQKTV